MINLCTCEYKDSYYHPEPCPYAYNGEEEWLGGSIRMDTCRKCFTFVTNFEGHWKVVHSEQT